LVNIGFSNFVNEEKIIAIADLSTKSQPITRAVKNAKDMGMVIDATMGRKANTVIFADSGHVILAHPVKETISKRIEEAKQC